MPHLLSVEHILQDERAGCLAACSQMVLAYLGIFLSQKRLNQVLGLTQIGAPAFNIQRLSEFGVSVEYVTGDETSLCIAIDQGLAPIAFLMTGDLPYWTVNIHHAVVVVGYDDSDIYFNDPVFENAPQQASWGDFILAWSEFDYRFALMSSSGVRQNR
jgi:ABC-type bacteriocin/lantibiotic exporter with double-glycine peptidase domain